MQRGFLLNIVIRQGAAVLELLSGEDETLLIGRDSLLILNFGLDIVDGVTGLYIQRDGLACRFWLRTEQDSKYAMRHHTMKHIHQRIGQGLKCDDMSVFDGHKWDCVFVLGHCFIERIHEFTCVERGA